jgi:hypothetical protein
MSEDIKYLNGFTIISFDFHNQYATFKSEVYHFDDEIKSQEVTTFGLRNFNDLSTIDTTPVNTNIEYWIIEDVSGTNKIKIISNEFEIIGNNVKAGPIYDEESAMILLNYFNDLEIK